MMEQGLVDILDKAKKVQKVHGELSPYMISCRTLIAILETLEAAETELADLMASMEIYHATLRKTEIELARKDAAIDAALELEGYSDFYPAADSSCSFCGELSSTVEEHSEWCGWRKAKEAFAAALAASREQG